MRYAIGNVVVDGSRLELRRGDQPISVQPLVLELLLFLLRNRGRVVSKDELLDSLWHDAAVGEGSLARAVSLARKAIGDSETSRLIRTFPRRGYRFTGEVREIPDEPGAASPDPVGDGSGHPPIPRTRYARSGSTHVAFQVLGDGPVDVVIVHGWTLSMQSVWAEPAVAAFHRRLARNARLILFDKRGTGLSDRVKALPGLSQRMEDLRAVVDAAGSERAFLIGVSEGAPMSILYAAVHPVRTLGLCLIGGFAHIRKDTRQPFGWDEEAVARLDGYVREEWGAGSTILAAIRSRRDDAEVVQWAARAEEVGASPGAALELWSMNQDIDVREVVPALRVPTLVMHSSDDPVVHVEHGRQLARRIADARYVELSGHDHLMFLGRDAERSQREIESWLSQPSEAISRRRRLATLLYSDVTFPPEGEALDVATPIHAHGGEQARFDGGPVIASFSAPAAAVRCALAIRRQAELQGAPRARQALHCGEVELTPGDGWTNVRGGGVELGAEIFELATPGDILVSRTLRDLLTGSGIGLESRGEFRLEAAPEPWSIFAVANEPGGSSRDAT